MPSLDDISIRPGTETVAFVALLVVVYLLYQIEVRQRQQLEAMNHQARLTKEHAEATAHAFHSAVAAPAEAEHVDPEAASDAEVAEAAQEAVEGVQAQAQDSDEGN